MEKLFIGIDVSKGFADFAVISTKGEFQLKPFKLTDNTQGHQSLLQNLSDLRTKHGQCEINCAMEITGGYETHWFQLLSNCNKLVDNVYVINGYHTKHYQKAINERNKTDAICSYVIAKFLSEHYSSLAPTTYHIYKEAKKLYSLIDFKEREKTKLINQLRMYLYESFPEFLSIMGDKFANWGYLLLLKYPTKHSVKKAKLANLLKIPYVKKDNMVKIVQMCKESIIQTDSKTDFYSAVVIKDLVINILRLQNDVKKYLQMLKDIIPNEQVELLKSIPGVGEKLALELLVLIGDINNFKSPKKLAAYFGVHPTLYNSGNVVCSKMSKQGNPLSRCVLYQITLQMFKKSSCFYPYIQEQVEKKKIKMVVMGKCMHLISRLVWAILTNKENFSFEKFEKDHKKVITKQKTDETYSCNFNDTKESVLNAPLSNKMKKFLKENFIRREPQDNDLSFAGSPRPLPKVRKL